MARHMMAQIEASRQRDGEMCEDTMRMRKEKMFFVIVEGVFLC